MHDADTEKASNGNVNPAWSMNSKIMNVVRDSAGKVNVVACIEDFETALFDKRVTSDKPYNSLSNMKTDKKAEEIVKKLFDGLLDPSKELPEKCKRWQNIEDLK